MRNECAWRCVKAFREVKVARLGSLFCQAGRAEQRPMPEAEAEAEVSP